MKQLISNNRTGESCMVCDELKEKGIHLFTQFICIDCEKDLVKTETNDQKYKYYLEKLRRVTEVQLYS